MTPRLKTDLEGVIRSLSWWKEGNYMELVGILRRAVFEVFSRLLLERSQ